MVNIEEGMTVCTKWDTTPMSVGWLWNRTSDDTPMAHCQYMVDYHVETFDFPVKDLFPVG